MNVLVDHQIFLNQTAGGVSRYHATINDHINRFNEDVRSTIVALGHKNIYIPHQGGALQLLNRRGLLRLLKKVNENAVRAKLGRFDIFHPTFYDGYFVREKKRPRTVITIHDMIPEVYFKEKAQWMIDQKREALKIADAIIAISHSTKMELLSFYPLDESKIHVIHHGFPEEFASAPANNQDENDGNSQIVSPYILYVGTRKDYKNFEPLVRSIATYLKDKKIQLLAVGSKATETEQAFIAQLGLDPWVRFTGQVSDEKLAGLYRNARCFVFPSSLEGFGMPLLESFASNCPVACANTGVFREICADAAKYFDPFNQVSVIEAVDSFASNLEIRNQFREKGKIRLKQFNWPEAARNTMEVYKSLHQQ